MAILIDPPAWPAHGTLWSHLVSDSDYAELHAFAARLGVPRRGFDLDHYDVPAARYDDAVALGARPVTAKDVVHGLRDSGLRVRQVDKPAMQPVRRREYLVSEWADLGQHVGGAGPAWLRLGDELLARWNEPHRVYHTERHLEDVLFALNQIGLGGEQVSPVTLLAAWFHDAVYQGTPTDEQESADLAVRELSALGVAPGLIEAVSEHVVATTPGHDVGAVAASVTQLLDADLSIFAASPQRYSEYTSAVRQEYAHVADADFAAGRGAILSRYLAQPTIYRSPAARQLWEARARVNLAAEIASLRGTSADREAS